MTNIPPFILKKIFRKGCAVINDDNCCTIKVVNAIAPMRITKLTEKNFESLRAKFDDELVDFSRLFVRFQEITAPYSDLTPLHGYLFDVDDTAELIYKGKKIEPGLHTIEISDNTANPVFIKFSIKFHAKNSSFE